MEQIKIRKDLTGKIFTRLKVISRASDIYVGKYRKTAWNCICECNKKLIIRGDALVNETTKSCGCFQKECAAILGFSKRKYTKIDAMMMKSYYSYMDGNITFEKFKILSQKLCFYCGAKPSSYVNQSNSIYLYNGLDRIDNNNVHNIDNVLTSCKYCNYARKTMKIEYFIEYIKRLINFIPINIIVHRTSSNNINMCDIKIPYLGSTIKAVYKDVYADGDLTIEQFYKLSQLNCYYCGSAPKNCRSMYKPKYEEGKFIYNGIDRIDNSLKHNYENSITCCKDCNMAKKKMSIGDFFIWINKLRLNYDIMIKSYGELYG